MTIMIVCVIFLGLEGATKSFSTDQKEDFNGIGAQLHLTSTQMRNYSYLAIMWGLITPIFFTIKAYVIRVYCANYKPWDLGIDG